MSAKEVISPTNILFLVAGAYFLAIAGLNEGSFYSVVPAILCFVSFAVSFKSDWFFSAPWRVATSVLVLVLLVSQLISDSFVSNFISPSILASIMISGVLFVLFVGVTLAALFTLVRHESEEEKRIEEKEEEARRKKESKKITYEV